jgi:hypothetical protein
MRTSQTFFCASCLVMLLGTIDSGAPLFAQSAPAGGLPPYYGRSDYRLIPDGDRVLLAGGAKFDSAGNGTFFNDLWETTDFVKWEKLADAVFKKAPPFVGVFNKDGHLVLFNGAAMNKRIKLQFMEVDGKQLTEKVYETIPPECLDSDEEMILELSLSGHFIYSRSRVFEFQNEKVLVDSSKGVWKQEKGKWKNVLKANKAFAGVRYGSALVMHEGEAYLLAGSVGEWEDYDGYCNDVWKSSDGVTWRLISKKTGQYDIIRDDFESFPARAEAVAVSFKGKLYIVGGNRRENYFYDDVWASTDGVEWARIAGKEYDFDFSKKDFTK